MYAVWIRFVLSFGSISLRTISRGSKQIAVTTRVPISVHRHLLSLHKNSMPIEKSISFIWEYLRYLKFALRAPKVWQRAPGSNLCTRGLTLFRWTYVFVIG